MSRHNENECAFCAEELDTERSYIGEDWKVYCSKECAEAEARIDAELREATNEHKNTKVGRSFPL